MGTISLITNLNKGFYFYNPAILAAKSLYLLKSFSRKTKTPKIDPNIPKKNNVKK